MASMISIWNLALGHIGQDANVSDPNEQSMEAEYCRNFYPVARDTALEDFAWTFASKRANLGLLSSTQEPWLYAYALPADCLKPRRVLPQEPCNDQENLHFLVENGVVYTNVKDAVLVYTYNLTDTTKFSPKFVLALSRLLASFLAGPILKDTTGRAAAAQMQIYMVELGKAEASNGNSDNNPPPYVPSSIAARYSYGRRWGYWRDGEWIGYPSGFVVE